MKEERKKVFLVASVPSMIGQFNMLNIQVLQEMGYQVEVGCNFLDRSIWGEKRVKEFEKELEEKKVRKHQIDFSRKIKKINENWKAYRQLKEILLKEDYKFIHCHTPIGGVIGRIAGHREGIKIIYTAHGFHFYKGAPIQDWLLYYPVEMLLSKWTDILITINQEDYQRAKKIYAKKVEYVPGVGIDLEKIEKVQVRRKEKRRELGIPEEAIVMVSAGELSKRKNHIAVIKAMGRKKEKKIYYVICGQGTWEQKLKETAKREGINEQVKILGFRTDVIEIYKASDIFVFPSKQEGLPVALMEAMAAGLPCIVSDIRGNRDLIQNEINGKCIPLKKFERDLEIELKDYIRNPRIWENYARLGKEAIKEKSWDHILRKMDVIYRTISDEEKE